jgi:ubiquinone/menaquinone biosynthesis C-methylase UbiE
MDHEDRQEDSWNKYWEHGFLTSCRNAFAGNYEGAIRDRWVDFFSSLSVGDRALDICTGNGAIAMIANQVSRDLGLELEIHGVDSAAIRPTETVTRNRELLEGIQFHGSTPAECTSFPEQYFQAIVGQYALEYTPIEGCVSEMARIAAPGARLQFIIHHDQSIVMDTSREEIRNVSLLFEETALFDKAAALILIVGSAGTPEARQALQNDPRAEAAREALNEAAARVTGAAESSEHPQLLHMALKNVAEAYKTCGTGGVQSALSLLQDCRERITANAERLEDLMSAGRTEAQVDNICAVFTTTGFEVEPPSLVHHERGPLMGWMLRARKS